MKNILLLLIILTAGCLRAGEPSGNIKPVVFDFNDSKKFAARWLIRRTALHVPKSSYKVADCEGARDGKALVVECRKSSGIALISPPELDLKKTPVMRWRWRIISPVVLKGAKEPDDQACSIYVCDGNTLRQFTVSYRWEILPDVGSVKLKRYSGGAVTVYGVCMRNQHTPCGEWVEEERDILLDFHKLFKRDVMNRFAIGIAGNSQYTKSNTRVEIDYIEFHPRKTTK